MAITTTAIPNYSGLIYSKTDNSTPFTDAVLQRGKMTNKVNSIEFPLSVGYALDAPSQPNISETQSIAGTVPQSVDRTQEINCVQIFQQSVEVSYLKQSSFGQMAGVNIAGQMNSIPNELDNQITFRLAQMKKDLNYTLINGLYVRSAALNVAWRTRGVFTGITTNAVDAGDEVITKTMINSAIKEAIANGFSFEDGNIELWCNPIQLDAITNEFIQVPGFNQPSTRTDGGVSINSILTHYGIIRINYDPMIKDTEIAIVNMNKIGFVELDYIDKFGTNKGVWFYAELAKPGASDGGQIYAQVGIDYGAENAHIKLTKLGV